MAISCRWRWIWKFATVNSPGTSKCRRATPANTPIRQSIFIRPVGRRYAVFRRRPVHHQVQQFLVHRGAARLLAVVHASAQPHRSAVHDNHRASRLRHLHRQPGEFSGALAQREFQWRAAEGYAGGAMLAGQTRTLGRPLRGIVRRARRVHRRNEIRTEESDRSISSALPRAEALTAFPQILVPCR